MLGVTGGAGVVLVGVSVADGDVGLGVVEGLDDGAGNSSGSHDCLLAGAAAA